jgi:hypothetical protein
MDRVPSGCAQAASAGGPGGFAECAEWIVYLLVALRQPPPGGRADLRSVMRISGAAITMAAARKMNATSGETVVQRIPAAEDAIRFPIDWTVASSPKAEPRGGRSPAAGQPTTERTRGTRQHGR